MRDNVLRIVYLTGPQSFALLTFLARSDRTKAPHILTLRHQVAVFQRQVKTPWQAFLEAQAKTIASVRVLRRDRLGGLIHEYSQVA
jgi:hypothetical protein